MRIALAGNPNSGKTTLFNGLTKLKQKIGNWPGVTVEKKEGRYFADKSVELIDLPGIYSLNPVSDDERAARNYLLNGKPDAIINVLDSANLERGLVLSLQLLGTGIPVILALNMEDELNAHGLTLDTAAIEREMRAPVIFISAKRRRNLKPLMDKAVKAAKSGKPEIFVAEGETDEEKTEFRYNYIASKIDLFRVKSTSRIKKITSAIDKIVLNRWLAFPIFAAVIFVMYFVSVQTVGRLSTRALERLFFDLIGANVRAGLTNAGAAAWVSSLAADGIIRGVGMVLAFIPQIVVLFIFITFLESCGYMARVAVIMDRLFKKLGLSGKSFIPMIIGCGCTVPAIMSAKTVEGSAEKRATVMLTPFIPCSAKLPVFAMMAGALFPNNVFVAPSMYFLGIAMVIIGGLLLKTLRRRKREDNPFVLELPHYRLPKFRNTLSEIWEKVRGFLIRAGVIIVPAAIILWVLQSFNFGFQPVDIENSMLAAIGGGISWIFAPLGFGNWQSAIAVISGFFAKETVVATFGIILGEGESLGSALNGLFTPQAAYAFMAFILLSAPCVAAIAATKKEMGGVKWMFLAIGFQTAAAYVVALVINQAGNLWAYDRTLCISILAGFAVTGIFALCIYYAVKKRKSGGRAAGCGDCKGCKDKCCKDKNSCQTEKKQ
ncbi:MAG: ferrous iron transporter B [Firmicutes bacterium]|nr:ferrous iron transporter B [Bacillota bacterium]